MDTLSIACAINIAAEALGTPKGEALSRCVWCLGRQDPHGEWATYPIYGGDCGTCSVSGDDVLVVMRPVVTGGAL